MSALPGRTRPTHEPMIAWRRYWTGTVGTIGQPADAGRVVKPGKVGVPLPVLQPLLNGGTGLSSPGL